MKQLTIPCAFQGVNTPSPVGFYIGNPARDKHPLEFQSKWVGGKGGTIPQGIMENLKKIHELSLSNGIEFEELCFYLFSNSNVDAESGINDIDISKYTNEFIAHKETSATNSNEQIPVVKKEQQESPPQISQNAQNGSLSKNITKQSQSIITNDDFDLLVNADNDTPSQSSQVTQTSTVHTESTKQSQSIITNDDFDLLS